MGALAALAPLLCWLVRTCRLTRQIGGYHPCTSPVGLPAPYCEYFLVKKGRGTPPAGPVGAPMPSSANLHTGIFAGRCGPVGWFPGHSAGWHIFRCCIACRSCRVQGCCTHCRAVWLLGTVIDLLAGRALMQGRTPSSAPVKPCFCCGCALIVAGARVQWAQKSRLAHPRWGCGRFQTCCLPHAGACCSGYFILRHFPLCHSLPLLRASGRVLDGFS